MSERNQCGDPMLDTPTQRLGEIRVKGNNKGAKWCLIIGGGLFFLGGCMVGYFSHPLVKGFSDLFKIQNFQQLMPNLPHGIFSDLFNIIRL